MSAEQIAAGLSEAQKRVLMVPDLLIIDNMQCVPDLNWPPEMIAYQWPYYDALSETGLAVRQVLQEQASGQ